MTERQETKLQETVTVNVDWGEVITIISEQFDPQDVFDKETLADWAEDNGYVEAE